jgi:hypothetical protein
MRRLIRCALFVACACFLFGAVTSPLSQVTVPGTDATLASLWQKVRPVDVNASKLEFTAGSNKNPRTWSSCTVGVWVDTNGAPKGIVRTTKAVLDDINSLGSVQLTYKGRVDDKGDADALAVANGGVVMAFASNKSAEFSRTPSALAVYRPTATNGHASSGVLMVATNRFPDLPATGPTSQHTLLAHEFLHAVGFAHSTDKNSIMSPQLGTSATITTDVQKLAPRLTPDHC